MLNVNGIEIDFDPSYPPDVARYKNAVEKTQAEEKDVVYPEPDVDSPTFLDDYMELLNIQLRLLGNFIDYAFGDGVAKELFGSKPSLKNVLGVFNDLYDALDAEGLQAGIQLERLELRSQGKYKPNRATRRAQ